MAENMEKYTEAERLYAAAHRMDPADPAPLRYLGELYRHQTGDWTKAREVFDAILKMPADPLSRAVALHGLGKMTIHDGEFKKGLALMEDSAREFPLALTYRNLAVYWHSEGDLPRADEYTKKALALDPTDPFNVVFAAAFMAGNGHGDEALKIARENESLLCASYNLAAIYAQIGQKDKALALLKRHFFEYERYRSVRSKEMMEARVDAVFARVAVHGSRVRRAHERRGRQTRDAAAIARVIMSEQPQLSLAALAGHRPRGDRARAGHLQQVARCRPSRAGHRAADALRHPILGVGGVVGERQPALRRALTTVSMVLVLSRHLLSAARLVPALQ